MFFKGRKDAHRGHPHSQSFRRPSLRSGLLKDRLWGWRSFTLQRKFSCFANYKTSPVLLAPLHSPVRWCGVAAVAFHQ